MLSLGGYGSKDLWHKVKALVREHESSDACLIFDDTIVSKPHTDANEVVCWHCAQNKGIFGGNPNGLERIGGTGKLCHCGI
jgi:hypothetical protein